ncbi:hypothetical protein [Planococcus sp. YIM B11945]|uniref:DISARM anti-phage system protein DrmE domain-containing protein n=1 Tax=Planococcus sp. YIM B11945 TaxID=3435410 RepID=UPI003D7C5A12
MRYLLGNKKTNLQLVNHFYHTSNEVRFVQIQAPEIEELVAHIKNLKEEVGRYYEGDEILLQETDEFVLTVQRMLGTLKSYSAFLREMNSALVKFFTLTKRPSYKNLHELYVEPLIKVLASLRNNEGNAYISKLTELLSEAKKEEKVYIITRHQMEEKELLINDRHIEIYKDKEFVKLGLFANQLFFIGTPSFFDKKFSEMFFSKKTFFLGYSCFENNISPSASFRNLISKKLIINTVYKGVDLHSGHKGIDYKISIKQPLEQYDEEEIVKRIESSQAIKGGNIQAKIVHISNNNYTLLPLDQSITTIDGEALKIQQTQIKNLETGDLLVFRTHNGSALIREVADDILGKKAFALREQQEKWKKRLKSDIEIQGIDAVVKDLQDNHGVLYVNKLNLSYWVSPLCIKPDALEKILAAMKFEENERKEIIRATREIFAAHIKAGRKISRSLMEEVNGHLEEVLGEKGYYKFESKVFAGASFNIEEIKAISKQTVMVSENEILKIFKN